MDWSWSDDGGDGGGGGGGGAAQRVVGVSLEEAERLATERTRAELEKVDRIMFALDCNTGGKEEEEEEEEEEGKEGGKKEEDGVVAAEGKEQGAYDDYEAHYPLPPQRYGFGYSAHNEGVTMDEMRMWVMQFPCLRVEGHAVAKELETSIK